MVNKEKIHRDHIEWKSKLSFYQDEIRFFFKELNRVFDKDKENLAKMELIDEYESILDHSLKNIDGLKERITKSEHSLAEGVISANLPDEHAEIESSLTDFSQKFCTIKEAFKRFSAHND